MRRLRETIIGLVAGVLLSVGLVPASVYAAEGTLSPPFDSGTTWTICQGYNGPVTHMGSDALALDFTSGNCDNGATGRIVRAPSTGQISSYGSAYGSLCINTVDGRSIALIHIDTTVSVGQVITAGQQVGTVAPPNTRGNGGIAHLHLQMWSTPGCYNANTIPFDTAHQSRICGAPDLTQLGPNYSNNGTWSGLTYTPSACDATITPVYRFWSPKNQHHFYTASQQEATIIQTSYPSSTWTYEGVAYSVPSGQTCTDSSPVYRFWSNKNQSHFFTISAQERDIIISSYDENTWKYEGVAYCAYTTRSTTSMVPVFRFWSNKLSGHFYTTSAQERDIIISSYDENTWKYEGVAYYVY